MAEQRHTAEELIQQLALQYALGTDAIGRGDVQQGKELYGACFTPDAVISMFFPNPTNDFSGQPDETRTGPAAWAEFVDSVFRTRQYNSTQHLIGTFQIHVHGNTAIMTSYLHATHKRSNTSIDVANGTYEDDVVRQRGRWRIRRRTLKLITFLNLTSPAAT